MEMELYGRRDIYTSAETITDENVLQEVSSALNIHFQNFREEDYLYWYRRGKTPIRDRVKEVRPEICNKINENHAEEFCAFKDGYFLTDNAYYVARTSDSADKVAQLNQYLYLSGKQQADHRLVDWFHTVGKAALYVEPYDDDDCPIRAYALDPRQAFVVYSTKPGNAPMFAVNMVVVNKDIKLDVITKDYIYRMTAGNIANLFGTELVGNTLPLATTSFVISEKLPNVVGEITIIEYRYNLTNMGCFEAAVDIFDAMNACASDRLDGIDQFIQSLLVVYNAQFEEGVTANSIREAGMIYLKSQGDSKADIKQIADQLNQSETQVLVDYMYQTALTICGMPNTSRGSARSTSDTGTAVLAREGWFQADSFARNTEDLFLASNKYFDRIFAKILKSRLGFDVNLNQFELRFPKNETVQIQSKAQAFATLKDAGLHPILAMQKSGVSNDAVADYEMSKEFMNPQTEGETPKEGKTPGAGTYISGYWR